MFIHIKENTGPEEDNKHIGHRDMELACVGCCKTTAVFDVEQRRHKVEIENRYVIYVKIWNNNLIILKMKNKFFFVFFIKMCMENYI